MNERIPFGEKLLPFVLPDPWKTKYLYPNRVPSFDDPQQAISAALENPFGSLPLKERVKPNQRVSILVSDITRLWVRTDLFLPSILRVLNEGGVKDHDIVLIVATGTHRDNSREEIRRIVGEETFRRVRIINHHANDERELTYLGRSPYGTQVRINRSVAESDLVIVTGGITFHSLSGFSGGRKAILPGISGYETVQQNHRLSLKEGGGVLPTVKKGSLEKNPVSDDMLAAARMIPNTFLFNVVMDENGKLVQAVSGDLEKAHLEGCRTVQQISTCPIRQKTEVVVAAPGGYPWDISLYQSIKTLENATYATQEGGIIILVTECRDGLGPPDWAKWFDLGGVEGIERELRKGFTIPGFIALKTASFTRRFRVLLVSQLPDESAKKAGMIPTPSMSEAVCNAWQRREETTCTFIPSGSFVFPIHMP